MAQIILDTDDDKVDMTLYIRYYEEQLERLKKLAPYVNEFGITRDDLKFLLRIM